MLGIPIFGTGSLRRRCCDMKQKRSFFASLVRRVLTGFATLFLGGILGLAIMTQMLLSERKPLAPISGVQQEGLITDR